MTVMTDWKDDARLLRAQGKSEREIAEAVGKAASTVHEVVKDVEPRDDSNGHGHEPDALERLAGGKPMGDARELEEEAGPAVGAMPTPGQQTIDGQEVQPPVDEIVVTGPAQLSFFNAGGKRPGTASLTLTGGKVGLVDGTAFEKGTVVRGTFEAVVFGVGQHDKRDEKTGVVVSCEQRHTARILDLTVNPET